MLVFRIEREKYLENTLDGIGAALNEGFRWNSLNTRLVYTSESRALAMLEISVHIDFAEDLPSDRYFVEIEIPEEVSISELYHDDLPVDWDAKPPILETQYIGDDFTMQKDAGVLKVPSCIIPLEYNYLINPNHEDAKKIRVMNSSRISFDSRFGR